MLSEVIVSEFVLNSPQSISALIARSRIANRELLTSSTTPWAKVREMWDTSLESLLSQKPWRRPEGSEKKLKIMTKQLMRLPLLRRVERIRRGREGQGPIPQRRRDGTGPVVES